MVKFSNAQEVNIFSSSHVYTILSHFLDSEILKLIIIIIIIFFLISPVGTI